MAEDFEAFEVIEENLNEMQCEICNRTEKTD